MITSQKGDEMLRKKPNIFTLILVLSLFVSGMVFSADDSVKQTNESTDLQPGDVNVVPLQITGPPEERLNLILLGDGYTAGEMDKFHADVDRNQNVQWSVEPFRSYRNYFNVYVVETPSVDTGISCDPDDGNVRRNTVFNLQYANQCPADPLARGITYGSGGAQARNEILTNHVAPALGLSPNAQNIQTLALANTFTYGGIGGVHATTSAGSPQGPLVSLHELAHSLGNLQDEYAYRDRGVPGAPHPDSEPNSIHHTRMTSEEMIQREAKWWRWLGEESESGGIIRAADPDGYESGLYNGSNVWRPSPHSMMRHTGFYFDQVSREHMVQRITGMRNAGQMPVQSTPEGEVGDSDVLWVETMHPRFHMLDVTWEINGEAVADRNNSRHLDLSVLNVQQGDEIKVTVQDRTEFVRDPQHLDGPRMTQTREWTIGEALPEIKVDIEFTNSSSQENALAYDEIAFVQTPNPNDRMLTVTWELNGEELPNTDNSRLLDLSALDLPDGASELTVTVTDPGFSDDSDSITWIVDNGLPTAPRTLSDPLTSLSGDEEHNIYFNEFDMFLDPQDDQPGFVVGELRLNGQGWFNYFGFPDEPEGTPFTFAHSGTDVKELTYGNLGSFGLSIATFERTYTEDDPYGPFIPGFGTHTIEHRAIDATGNIGDAEEFQATVLPGDLPECTETLSGNINGGLTVKEGVTCLDSAQVRGGLTVENGASLIAFDSSINGGIKTSGGEVIQLFGTTVNGNSAITGTSSNITLAGNSFNGGLTLSQNNQISANEQYGEYGPILSGNDISGKLTCTGNNATVTDFGASNNISGKQSGDCGGL